MKKILLSAISLITFLTFYGQENQLKNQRLTASFEKPWNTPLVTTRYNIHEVIEVKANKYQNPIEPYAKLFFDTTIKRKKAKHLPLRPPYASAFILNYKPK